MGGRSEPAPVNRLVISSADSNTGSFGIPKTVALGLVLQLGVPWVNWRITSRTCTTISSTTSEVSAVPDACQMTGGLPPCWAPWWVEAYWNEHKNTLMEPSSNSPSLERRNAGWTGAEQKHLILTFSTLTSHRPLKFTSDAQFDRTSQIRCAAFSANDTATRRTSVGASLPALVAGNQATKRRFRKKEQC
ncbi:hypothetical protein TNCV_4042241 [Trichonephila clavipes]|nr:hypothetical protein TNCV_4042241 [Trichonephila clavipes]